MLKHHHLERCDSTQDQLKEQLRLQPNEHILISCDQQLAGKGRGLNHWKDGPGTLCFSLTVEPHTIPSFTALEISVLLSQFFEKSGHLIKLKWPNDLITKNGLKCGGVLIINQHQRYLAGIGLNLFWSGDEFGGVYEEAFIFDKSKWSLDIANYIHQNRFQSTQPLITEWLNRCAHLNEAVKITEDLIEQKGTFIGIGNHGEALLQTNEGTKHIYNGSLRLI